MVQYSANAKARGNPGLFHFLVEAAGIEPASEGRRREGQVLQSQIRGAEKREDIYDFVLSALRTIFKNAAGRTIRTCRYVFKSRRSLSPVTTYWARASMAASRNLLSSGSRLTFTRTLPATSRLSWARDCSKETISSSAIHRAFLNFS